jgi:protein-tyrosine phosphatase
MVGLIPRLASAMTWRLRCYRAARAARRTSRAVLSESQLRRLLVVCYGNIYRSPYVAQLLRARLGGLCEVRSSGFHPVTSRHSPPQVVAIGTSAGIDLTGHRSAMVTAADLAWADTIILMDRHNWQALQRLAADPRKLVWLGALDDAGDIPDPYGRSEDRAKEIMHRVHRCADALADAVLSRGRVSSS